MFVIVYTCIGVQSVFSWLSAESRIRALVEYDVKTLLWSDAERLM